jgi:membrane-anchored protein YejM (alkaline phosphatase superfamily)
VHDAGRSTALFSAKTKFALFKRTWNYHGATDRTGVDNGRKKIDRVVLDTDNTRLVNALIAELNDSPRTFTFLHISLPDLAGPRYGFMSSRYLTAVRRSDRLVGRVLETVTTDPDIRDGMAVILTADHGGRGRGHGNPATLSNHRVPFMVWGRGVPAGRNLYSLNPDYRSPGSRRPTYSGRQPVRNGAVANLATDLLGLPAVPGSLFNTRHNLTVLR